MASLPSASNRGRGGRGRNQASGNRGRAGGGLGDQEHGNRDRRGDQKRNDGERSHKPSPLQFQKLRRMITMDQTDTVLDLLKHAEQLQNMLEDSHIKDEYLELILEILAKVYETHMKGNLMKILALFPNTAFLQKSLPRYIMQLPMRGRTAKPEKHIQNIILFFDQLFRRFPDLYSDVPLDSLHVVTTNMKSSLQFSITSQVEELVETRKAIIEGKTRKHTQKSKNLEDENHQPPDDFRQLSVHPVTNDFEQNKEVFLRKNIVEGKYENVDHYLDVQFRLLREDFLGPLREGVKEILQGIGRNERSRNLRVYHDVVIIDTVCTNAGIVYIIRFNVRHLRKVNWGNSKRLIFGAFLCLSKDNFNTLVFAVITERDAEQLKDGYLQVRFLGDMPELQAEDRFQMVESPGYYESYVHNLEGLQELNSDKLPFSRYLVHCETTVDTPQYLENSPMYDLRMALGVKKHRIAAAVPVLQPTLWPSLDDVQLNHSQLEAIKAALTKEFVVIQGPPGTGKTYVGLRIVQALLDNSQYWSTKTDPPQPLPLFQAVPTNSPKSQMLVVCYTNHALDQFLEGILQFQQHGIVRVGGRSTSDDLKEHNLSYKTRRTAAWYQLKEKLQTLNTNIRVTKEGLSLRYTQLLGLNLLCTVMEKQVLDQLLPYQPIANYMGTTVIEQWLNMEPLPMYAPPSVTYDLPSSWQFRDQYENYDDENEETNDNDSDDDEEENDEEENDEEEEEEEKEEKADHDGNHNNDIDNVANADTVDVEKDAELLQRERQINDDYAPIDETSKETTKIGMTQDYINMLHQRLRENDNDRPQYRDQMILQPNQNVWFLDYNTRQHMHTEWVRRYQEMHGLSLTELTQEYGALCKEFNEVRHGEEERVLRDATVIGMTTTGAAKYRNVLQKLQPKIVVVEEAAEVLEAHIITALSKGTEHLILIGDHKQLRPNPNVYTLAKEYNLEVSLFERMVKNGMDCHTLDTQHRMRPEIARLMKHIYEDLKDHESVHKFPNIDGISTNIFFVDHQQLEKEDEELRSPSNRYEADYIVALCRYLLLQGYDKSRITVLTTYTGQLLELKQLMPKSQFEGVRLCTVDNFQGEENDIILLSLVRSNNQEKIGFLGSPNRACVALSRARMGFYCIGNISMLARKSDLWAMIKADLEKQNIIGPGLPIYCRNHKKTKTYAASAKDFKNAPQGGCTLPCDFRLDCGHKCEMVCHPVDLEHSNYVCDKRCDKPVCSLDHRCKKRCHYGNLCGQCQTPVSKTLPRCGHTQRIPCSTDESSFECKMPCERFLPCGHRCQSTCAKDCSEKECQEVVEKVLGCGHKQTVKCSIPTAKITCEVPCEAILDCDHPCAGNCDKCTQGRVHAPCGQDCGRTLICSHTCQEPCTRECPPCQKDCENACMHSKCGKKCGDLCTSCQEPCPWVCKHKKCKLKCYEICDRPPCNVHCRRKLQCSPENKRHNCVGLCGEKCPKLCRICHKKELTEVFFGTEDKPRARFIELLDCSHVFEVTALDKWMAYVDEKVTDIQLKQCPKCKTPIRKSLRYGNVIKKTLKDIENVKKKVLNEDGDSEKKRAQLMDKVETLRRKYPLAISEEVRVFSETARGFTVSTDSAYSTLLCIIRSCKSNECDSVENQIQLLTCIYESKTKYSAVHLDENHPGNALNSLVRKIFEWKLTSQVVKEIQEEIVRVSLECKLEKLQQDINRMSTIRAVPQAFQTYIKDLSSFLSDKKKIEESTRTEINQNFDRICVALGLGVITAVEKAQIVKAVGLSQGHWFKCPNGHVYAIGECGGAMERGKCPECGETIGGEHHALVAGNQLAPEMDGAQHAAWSDQTNLENYDQAELRRL